MKTEKLKPEKRYDTSEKNYNKTVMYEFDFNVDIMVEEKQANGKSDQTLLHYSVNENEKGFFSEEYRPEGVNKEGTKKPDITAMIENFAEKRVKWFIYDMKATVINADTALKLCSQWHSGIKHITKEYLQNLKEYHIENSLGVVTRYWNKEMLQKEIDTYSEKINNIINNTNSSLGARKSQMKISEYREKIKTVKFIINEVFQDWDEETEDICNYKINYVIMNPINENLYVGHLSIDL